MQRRGRVRTNTTTFKLRFHRARGWCGNRSFLAPRRPHQRRRSGHTARFHRSPVDAGEEGCALKAAGSVVDPCAVAVEVGEIEQDASVCFSSFFKQEKRRRDDERKEVQFPAPVSECPRRASIIELPRTAAASKLVVRLTTRV